MKGYLEWSEYRFFNKRIHRLKVGKKSFIKKVSDYCVKKIWYDRVDVRQGFVVLECDEEAGE